MKGLYDQSVGKMERKWSYERVIRPERQEKMRGSGHMKEL